VPGDLIGDDDPLAGGLDQRLERAGARRGAGPIADRRAEEGDRPDQVIGELGHVELRAHRGTMIVALGDTAGGRTPTRPVRDHAGAPLTTVSEAR